MPLITNRQSEAAGPAPLDAAVTGHPQPSPVPPSPIPESTYRAAEPSPTASAPPVASPGRRRRWKAFAIPAVVLAAAGGGAIALTSGDSSSGSKAASTAAAPAAIRAVKAEQRDLASTKSVDGTIQYDDAEAITAAVDGTVTKVAEADTVLARGDTLYELNASPVTVFWGDTPFFRTLENGIDAGPDVRVLEENLAALDFTAEGTMVVDETFDSATADAVKAWQADLGVAETGSVAVSDVVVMAGPASVAEVSASAGSSVRAGSPVVSVQVRDSASTVTSGYAGRATLVPRAGATLATGDVAYEHDTVPVPAVVGTELLDRELKLGVSDGADVEQLETALTELGYTDDGNLEVDETFDEHTEQAVKDWEDALGLETVDGVIELGQYVVVPAGSTVLDVLVERGDTLANGDALFTTAISTRHVDGMIDSADEGLLSVGNTVGVEFADGSTSTATITGIDPSRPDAADPANDITPFTLSIGEIPEAYQGRSEIKVDLTVTEELAKGATVVPATALIGQGDGSYVVEVVSGQSTKYVKVATGLFADGYVAVEGIDVGTAVVVPS